MALDPGWPGCPIPTINSIYNNDLRHQLAGFHAISYRRNGERAGEIAVRILKGEKPSAIPVYVPGVDDFQSFVSPKGLALSGRQVPDAMKSCNCFVPD